MGFSVSKQDFHEALLHFIRDTTSYYLSLGELPWELVTSHHQRTFCDESNLNTECIPNQILYAKRHWIQSSSSSTLSSQEEPFLSSLVVESSSSSSSSTLVSPTNLYRFEVHLVYHEVFEVPAIYFQIAPHPSSIPLSHFNSVLSLLTIPSVQLIQQVHPHLSLPFWLIHPCQTTALLSPFTHVFKNSYHSDSSSSLSSSYSWFYTWLSVFGQVFGGLIPTSIYVAYLNEQTHMKKMEMEE